jgi:TonB family protein
MRKTTFVGPLSGRIHLFCLVALGLICLPAFAQDAAPVAAPAATQALAPANEAPTAALPSDPKALMLLAAKTNGLTGPDVQPWHLKGSYIYFDEKGNSTDQGIYEEYWVSPTKYKLTFTSTSASRTEFGTEKGILVSDKDSPVGTHDLRRLWISPMPVSDSIKGFDFSLRLVKVQDEDLNCLYRKGANGDPSGPIYCLDPKTSILRLTQYPGDSERAIRKKIVSSQGHYFAEDLQVYYGLGSKGSLTAHLDSIEALNPVDEAVFTPPSSAVPQKIEVRTIHVDSLPAPGNGQVTISSGVAQGLLVTKVPPLYPPIDIQGTVVLQATISKDGHIADLHVISGPPMLQQAALDAVKQWRYRPYLLNGVPVEVLTTVYVVFTLNGH